MVCYTSSCRAVRHPTSGSPIHQSASCPAYRAPWAVTLCCAPPRALQAFLSHHTQCRHLLLSWARWGSLQNKMLRRFSRRYPSAWEAGSRKCPCTMHCLPLASEIWLKWSANLQRTTRSARNQVPVQMDRWTWAPFEPQDVAFLDPCRPSWSQRCPGNFSQHKASLI